MLLSRSWDPESHVLINNVWILPHAKKTHDSGPHPHPLWASVTKHPRVYLSKPANPENHTAQSHEANDQLGQILRLSGAADQESGPFENQKLNLLWMSSFSKKACAIIWQDRYPDKQKKDDKSKHDEDVCTDCRYRAKMALEQNHAKNLRRLRFAVFQTCCSPFAYILLELVIPVRTHGPTVSLDTLCCRHYRD